MLSYTTDNRAICVSNSERRRCKTLLSYRWTTSPRGWTPSSHRAEEGCRDHAGITCFPHSGSWQAQGGPAYICRDQRKCVFHDMGPLKPVGKCTEPVTCHSCHSFSVSLTLHHCTRTPWYVNCMSPNTIFSSVAFHPFYQGEILFRSLGIWWQRNPFY